MPFLLKTEPWKGTDAFIIGGGPSLAGFDWELLRGKNTIGCNAAFRLGVDICRICFFSDVKWFESFQKELEEWSGMVVTHQHKLFLGRTPPKWLHYVRREKRGLHTHAIGFNGNSGCSAVNLALFLGAKRVFLLGFDCRLETDKNTHWHNWKIEEPNPAVYNKFMEGWQSVSEHLPKVFPGCEIINLGPDSAIPFFPKEPFTKYLNA